MSLARAIRIAIGGAAGLSAALAATPSLSQEALEEVVITGSRIRQNPLEERLPVLSVGVEEYAASGATSIADFVQKLPISGSAINRTNLYLGRRLLGTRNVVCCETHREAVETIFKAEAM